tara:strand:- start:698 stop:1180 length:483 start_codon:yes stop_codon:yes gene_type:complete
MKTTKSNNKLSKSFNKKVDGVLKNILSQEPTPWLSHNNGKLINEKGAWGEIKHNFAPGIYLRQMVLNPGAVIISGIHKRDHVWFLLDGEITVVTEEDKQDYIAPYVGFSNAGTRRVIKANDYSIFQNVFKNPTDNKDIDYLENYNYALTTKEYNEYIKNK